MTKIPLDLIEKYGLVRSGIAVADSYAKDAEIYLVPSLSNDEVQVYLAECDPKGNTNNFGMVDVFVQTTKCVHSRISLELLYSNIAVQLLSRIKSNGLSFRVHAAADKIFVALQQEAAVRAAQEIINKSNQ